MHMCSVIFRDKTVTQWESRDVPEEMLAAD